MPTSPLIFIVGPTATGKTSLAFDLAKKLNADILSADSRQVYQGLEITSGVDIPANWSKSEKEIGGYRFYSDGTTQLYGVSFLPTQAEWSIAHFRDYAETIWNETQRRGKMLIIVGGSGLYHRSLFLDKAVLTIGPSESLREELQQLSVEELQHRLSQQLPQASELLNHSDWNNPRRLVRWIEKNAP
jgi:tRNA dimethylallyltransferase